MKRPLLALLIGVLLIGGTGLASGATDPSSPPPKPGADIGDQTGARAVVVPQSAGTRNAAVQREYTPLATSCRLFDSRSSTPLTSGAIRTIPLTKCPAIPTYATSLSTSVSAIAPKGPGFLRVWSAATTEPTQTVLQWGAASATTGAEVTVSSSGLKARAAGGTIDLAIDVVGYWSEPIYVDVLTPSTTAFGDVYSSTGRISGWSSALSAPGQIVVTINRDIQYCDIQATAEAAGYTANAVYYSSQQMLVSVRDGANNPARAYASVRVTC